MTLVVKSHHAAEGPWCEDGEWAGLLERWGEKKEKMRLKVNINEDPTEISKR